MEKERKPSEVPTDNIDVDIPEVTGPRRPSFPTSAVGPATGLGDTAIEGPDGVDAELGPGERALEQERKARRARPGP